MTYKEFTKIIKSKRIFYKLKQQEMADIIHISISKYNKIENGSTEPSFSELILICKILNISLDEIINTDVKARIFNMD